MRSIGSLVLAVALTACGAGSEPRVEPRFDDIGEDETIRFSGNEPFWSGEVTGGQVTYRTPEIPEGETFAVTRFAGNAGLGLSGMMRGSSFDLMITGGGCDDTMADVRYPFTATLAIEGEDVHQGCAWTDRRPRTPANAP